MKKGLILLAAIVGVIVIGNVLIASAQTNSAIGGWAPGQGMMNGYTGTYTGTMPFRGGMMGGHGVPDGMMGAGGFQTQIEDAVAKKLGMTTAELTTALQSGQTIDQIAQSKNVSIDDLNKVALDAFKSTLADQVKSGAITQAQADALASHMTTPLLNFGRGGRGNMGRGNMMGGFKGVPGGMMDFGGAHQQVLDAIAKKLSMTSAELTTALQSGQTLAQLAQAKGVTVADLQKVAADAMKTELDALVKSGTITQQQADQMLSRMQNMPLQGFGFGFGGRPGGRGFGRGQGNQTSPAQPNGLRVPGTQPTGPQA